jgi:hypothetical protein
MVAAVVNLFAADASFAVLGGGRDCAAHGRGELLKTYASELTSMKPRPYIHNHVIEMKGNGRASGRCYLEVRNAVDNMNLLGTEY